MKPSKFHSMKVECTHGERFTTRDAMKQTVFEYIETDYNRNRLHSSWLSQPMMVSLQLFLLGQYG